MYYQLQRLCLVIIAMGVLTLPTTTFGFQKLKIGNGALLRKVFGGKDDGDAAKPDAKPEQAETPAKKSLWPNLNSNQDSQTKTNTNARATFDEARRKLEEDSRRLQEELRNKFKSPFQQNPQSQPKTNAQQAPGPIRESTPNRLTENSGLQSVLDHPQSRPANAFVPSGLTSRDAGPQNQPRVSPPSQQPANFDNRPEAGAQIPAGQGFGVSGKSMASGGVQVTDVKPGSMAALIGVRRGDVLENVAGLDLTDVGEIDAITNVLQKDDQIEVFFKRDGKPITKMMSGAVLIQAGTAEPTPRSNPGAIPLTSASTMRLSNDNSNAEIIRLQQQLQQQRAMIQQLQNQLEKQNVPQQLPPPVQVTPVQVTPAQIAPPALEEDFSLNLEPPR